MLLLVFGSISSRKQDSDSADGNPQYNVLSALSCSHQWTPNRTLLRKASSRVWQEQTRPRSRGVTRGLASMPGHFEPKASGMNQSRARQALRFHSLSAWLMHHIQCTCRSQGSGGADSSLRVFSETVLPKELCSSLNHGQTWYASLPPRGSRSWTSSSHEERTSPRLRSR